MLATHYSYLLYVQCCVQCWAQRIKNNGMKTAAHITTHSPTYSALYCSCIAAITDMFPSSYSLRAFRPITSSLVRSWQPPKHSSRNIKQSTQIRASHSPATSTSATPPPPLASIPWIAAAVGFVTLFATQGASAAPDTTADQDVPITVELLQGDSNVVQVLSKEALLAEELPLLDADHMVCVCL